MDKNFVNIDDLVRQRLGGGEENERTGAWLQMRDLLDQEMPQTKAGFIFWRRLFSAMAVLVLISGVSIGGYMYATSINGNNTNTPGNNDLANSSLAINLSATTATTNEINNPKQISTITLPGGMAITDNEHANKQNSEKATAIVKQTNKQILASNTTLNTEHNNKIHKETKNPKFLSQLIAANERSKQKANNNDVTPIIAQSNTPSNNNTYSAVSLSGVLHHNGKASNIHGSNKVNNTIALAGGRAHKRGGNSNMIVTNNQKTNAVKTSGNIASATHTPASKAGNNVRIAAANTNSSISANKLVLSSNTPATKDIRSVNTANIVNANTKSKPGNGRPNTKTMLPVTATNNEKEATPTDPAKETILRLTLSEHLVTTPTGETYYRLDTTSMETISEQLGLESKYSKNPMKGAKSIAANTPNASLASLPSASVNTPGSSSSNPNTAGTNITSSNTVAQSNGNTAILPVASASEQNGMNIKDAHVAKMGSGTSTAEKLSATFNDIKFHVAGVQFAPGLTAGINGTFFGPSSFKGFQFGVTGNFIFGDNFSILTELKYFERINNDYSLNDNYYTYTQAGGGQFNKVLNPVSYSFSTLHSIELPISIHYCKSHFNFYVGGNIVYAFAINTGEATSASVSTIVSATGSNGEPQIKATDFDSRFGLGYLLGISYQISPSVMLDLRNVQTVWDNASTPGAKMISNQLYKSPSLQVSIGYRFGGNKDKNKDQ